MTVLLRTDFGVLTAPIATLVQSTLFSSITSSVGANIVYQASGGPLQALIQDPIMKLTWTGAPPTNVAAFARKYVTYSPTYDDSGWQSARPSHYRFRCNINMNLAGFTGNNNSEIMLLRFFHNSGATALDYAAVWMRRTASGWKLRLQEYLWSGASCTPAWDFQGSTFGLATFAGYSDFAVDIVNVPGSSYVQVGQCNPDARSIFFGSTTTLINGEGYSQLFIGGVTLPRIAGFDIGCVTASVAAPFTGGGEIRFDSIKFEDSQGPNWSPSQNDSILGTTLNPPLNGHSNEIDCGRVRLFNTQAAIFGAPMSALYTLSHAQAATQLGTKVPATNIDIEPNGVYSLSFATDQSSTLATLYGTTSIAVREFVNDSFFPDSPQLRDVLVDQLRSGEFIFRTGPRQNSLILTCNQIATFGVDYFLRRLR